MTQYPKTYATIVEIKRGRNPNSGCQGLCWMFRTDNGQLVECWNPGRNGHTPGRVYTKSRAIYRSMSLKERKTDSCWLRAYVGERVKLWKRPGSDRQYWRFTGQ